MVSSSFNQVMFTGQNETQARTLTRRKRQTATKHVHKEEKQTTAKNVPAGGGREENYNMDLKRDSPWQNQKLSPRSMGLESTR